MRRHLAFRLLWILLVCLFAGNLHAQVDIGSVLAKTSKQPDWHVSADGTEIVYVGETGDKFVAILLDKAALRDADFEFTVDSDTTKVALAAGDPGD